MLKGIVILALGHPQYGRMAYNLCVSIKAHENFPVCVIWKGDALNHLDYAQKRLFDHAIELPDEYKTGFGAKLHLDQLTPFEKTLALDADMVWVKGTPSELFNSLDGVQFTGITEGDSDNPNLKYYFWAEPSEIKEKFKVEKVYQWRSEVLYFEKTKVFQKARSLNLSKLKTIRMFGPHIPDELYFNIATAILKVEPHKKWMPAYWARLNGNIMPKNMNGYNLLSAGSNWADSLLKKTYDNYVKYASNKIGVKFMFPLKSKKEWSPERLKI